MNKAILQRFHHGIVTFGTLKFEWLPELPDIYTLELPWLDNKEFVSCIPQGLYNVIPYNSDKHPESFKVLYVPNRMNILFHTGNYACDVVVGKEVLKPDTEGCVLVGLAYDQNRPMLRKSKDAMELMRDNVRGNWSIEVKN